MSNRDGSDRQPEPGPEYLTRRSALLKQVQQLTGTLDIVYVEDNPLDAQKITTSLRMMFGAHMNMRHAATNAAMAELIKQTMPDIILLDDRMNNNTQAEANIPSLRKRGFIGPIVILSGVLNPSRTATLRRLGVAAIVHKDDADSLRLTEIILRLRLGEP
jgi:DNA-binding NarL/FixJ family response regulator